MIIYNVTTIIEDDVHEAYIQYMKNVHMPEVMATGKFVDCHLLRLTDPVNEGITYCAQYVTDETDKLTDYRENYSPKLQQSIQSKFANKFVSFRSVLEKV
jgi:hypothetical protein